MSTPGSPQCASSSFVGSYEESLLSGRMSSVPSRPLLFAAELGVLGAAAGSAARRCPPHVALEFPAHFYSLEGVAAAPVSSKPSQHSPYVGTIDLEAHYVGRLLGLDAAQRPPGADATELLARAAAEAKASHGEWAPHLEAPLMASVGAAAPVPGRSGSDAGAAPVFPGYRVPPQGQVQLMIQNAERTAVKLFLVPYDLRDMPPGTKTFVRQKCLALPAVTAPASPAAPGSPRSSPAANARQSTAAARDTLRFAVHLQFCSPPATARSKGAQDSAADGSTSSTRTAPRIYLHKAIRVVFTARACDVHERTSVVTETPGGSRRGAEMYAPYAGPGETWREARRQAKKAQLRKERLAEEEEAWKRLNGPMPRDIPTAASRAGTPMELDAGLPGADRGTQDSAAASPLPPTPSGAASASSSASSTDDTGKPPSTPVCFPAATTDDGLSHRVRRNGGHKVRSTPPAAIAAETRTEEQARPTSPSHERASEAQPLRADNAQEMETSRDRALLEAWSATLRRAPPSYVATSSSNGAGARPASPAGMRPTSPTTRRPLSPPMLLPATQSGTPHTSPRKARSSSNTSAGSSSSAAAPPTFATQSTAATSTPHQLLSPSRSASPAPPAQLHALLAHGLMASVEDLSLSLSAVDEDAASTNGAGGTASRPSLGRRVSSAGSAVSGNESDGRAPSPSGLRARALLAATPMRARSGSAAAVRSSRGAHQDASASDAAAGQRRLRAGSLLAVGASEEQADAAGRRLATARQRGASLGEPTIEDRQ
jgi:hypothetical protein